MSNLRNRIALSFLGRGQSRSYHFAGGGGGNATSGTLLKREEAEESWLTPLRGEHHWICLISLASIQLQNTTLAPYISLAPHTALPLAQQGACQRVVSQGGGEALGTEPASGGNMGWTHHWKREQRKRSPRDICSRQSQ